MYQLRFLRKFLFSQNKGYYFDKQLSNYTLITSDSSGILSKVLQYIPNNFNLTHIRSELGNRAANKGRQCKFYISIQKIAQSQIDILSANLRQIGITLKAQRPLDVPWFPQKSQDLNYIGRTLLDVKDTVNQNHLQFSDQQYRQRRDFIAKVALNFKMGQKIPNVPYTSNQTELWINIYSKLRSLHKKSMCSRFDVGIQKLNKQFRLDKNIPQLENLSQYLKRQTNFTLKPTHGILSQRQFLNAFAFRVFCCTQYIRHYKTPEYTPQPDIVHEIIGHIPMFSDPQVAELSQKIGLLSLGASDTQITQLGTLYWFTLEFGVLKQANKNLGYGAGVASSIGEIENLLSSQAKFKTLEPEIDSLSSYPIQDVQPIYCVTESFQKALQDVSTFGDSIVKSLNTGFDYESRKVLYDRNFRAELPK